MMRVFSLNERRLIELVAASGAIARKDLAESLNLTGAAVTRLVSALDEYHLFEETPDRNGQEGQPKRLLTLRPGQFFSAGLIFSRQYIELAVLDLAGRVVGRESERISDQPVLELTQVATALLNKIIAKKKIRRSRLVGLGCAMPINFGPGGESVVAHGNFKELENPATFNAFLAAFKMPLWFENDGNASAIAEHVYGRQAGDGRALYLIHIGHGVGGGAVIDGTPFYGINGNACLPGFMYPDHLPRPSGDDLLKTLYAADYPVHDFNDIEAIMAACPTLDAWVTRAGTQLAQTVLAASAFMDPSVIVVGGRLPATLNRRIVEQIKQSSGRGPSTGLKVAPVRASALGPEGGAIGAACLPLFDTFFGAQAKTYGSRYRDGQRKLYEKKSSVGMQRNAI